MSVAVEPLPAALDSLAEAKAYLRLETDLEDGLLGRLIASATALCEEFIGQVLIRRDATEILPPSGDWQRLSLRPAQAITRIDGLQANGVAMALPVESYAIDIDAAGDGWVRLTGTASTRRLLVHYQVGMAAEWGELVEPLRQGIVRLAAHFYTHRDAADAAGPPAAVAALWRPWRRMRLR